MAMSREEREALIEEVDGQPLPPMDVLMDKWVNGHSSSMDQWLEDLLPEEAKNEGPMDVVGPDLVPDEEAIIAEDAIEVDVDPAVTEVVRRRVSEQIAPGTRYVSSGEDLRARAAAAAAALGEEA